ncbi:MAG TPA: hypothetical protein VEU28_04730 [Actinomycetota bacterium]|nr:hypothetical protein [Actinomycetota bacterium]
MAKQTKKRRKSPSPAERERRAKQRSALSRLSPEAPEMTKELREAAARGAESREEAMHVDSRDWREVKIQGREAEIVEAVECGDTARAKQILEEVGATPEAVMSAAPSRTRGRATSYPRHRAAPNAGGATVAA